MSFFMRYLCTVAQGMSAKTSSNNFKTEAMFKLQSTLGAPTGKDAGVLGLWVFQ